MSKENFYKKWAAWHTNEASHKKLDAVALVEGSVDDKSFWGKVFNHAQINVKVISGVDNAENKATGKTVCLKYLSFLNKRFFICIDSDYDYIAQRPVNYSACTFVLKTYAYAIENHYLASLTDERQFFLVRYSNIIYEAFVAHLNDGGDSASAFCRKVAPANAKESGLEELQKRIGELKEVDALSINKYLERGLTNDNAYLFVKAKILKNRLQCREELTFDHFPMDKILEDVQLICS